jgi:hypothetical protein
VQDEVDLHSRGAFVLGTLAGAIRTSPSDGNGEYGRAA